MSSTIASIASAWTACSIPASACSQATTFLQVNASKQGEVTPTRADNSDQRSEYNSPRPTWRGGDYEENQLQSPEPPCGGGYLSSYINQLNQGHHQANTTSTLPDGMNWFDLLSQVAQFSTNAKASEADNVGYKALTTSLQQREQELAGAKADISKLSEELRKAKDLLEIVGSRSSQQAQKAKSSQQGLKTRLDDQHQSNLDLQAKLRASELENERLTEELTRQKTEWHQILMDKQTSITNLQNRLVDQGKEKKDLEEKLKIIKNNFKPAREKTHSAGTAEYASTELEKLRERNHNLTRELKALKSVSSANITRADQEKSRADSESASANQAKLAAEALDLKLSNSESTIASLCKENANLKAQMCDLQINMTSLLQEHGELLDARNIQSSHLENHVVKLDSQNASLKASLHHVFSVASIERTHLLEEKNAFLSIISRLQQAMFSFCSEDIGLSAEEHEHRTAIANKVKEICDCQLQIQEVMAKHQPFQLEIEELRAKFKKGGPRYQNDGLRVVEKASITTRWNKIVIDDLFPLQNKLDELDRQLNDLQRR